MEYTKITDGNVLRVTMKGKFTFSDHTSFKTLFDAFNDDKIKGIEFNVKELEFVDSAALGLLLLARDQAQKTSKSLVLIRPMGQVKKMFEISRFYELFDIKE